MKKIFLTSFCFSILHCLVCKAQQGIWDGGQQQLLKVKDAGSKKVNKVKDWKKQAEKWGLDSNYNHALALSARLNTNGWSGGIQYIRQQRHHDKTLWQLYFSEIKQEKEIKQTGSDGGFSNLGNPSSFIFGKINNAYTLQIGYGKEKMILPALMDGNMSISLRYEAGPALALLKPYYLNLVYLDYNTGGNPTAYSQSERYSSSNADKFLESGSILGKGIWSKGLADMKYIPGLFGELCFAIEPDKPKSFIKTVLIGANAAFYASKITIMADQKAYPYQASFFVGLALGKRWK